MIIHSLLINIIEKIKIKLSIQLLNLECKTKNFNFKLNSKKQIIIINDKKKHLLKKSRIHQPSFYQNQRALLHLKWSNIYFQLSHSKF